MIVFIQRAMPPSLGKNIGDKKNNMKQVLFVLLVIIVFTGCEPSYRIYVRNSSSSDLYIKTHPSIESLYESFSTYRDSILLYKIKQEGDYSIYRIKPNDSMLIDGYLGRSPNIKDLSFDYIALISGSDTTILDSKEKILEQTKQMDKKRNYYIEIKK